MARFIAHLLACLALLAQVAGGALPAGEVCLCVAPPSHETPCCCDDECNSPVATERCCPCERECEHCIRVPVGDQRVTLAARVQPRQVQVVVVTPMEFGLAAPVSARAAAIFGPAPRIDGSPPHLGTLRSTRLIV